jgi:hypothetical protein
LRTGPGRSPRTRRGKQHGFHTEREAAAFRRETTREVDLGSYVKPARIRLGQYLETWLAGLRLKPQTSAGYRAKIGLHIVSRRSPPPCHGLGAVEVAGVEHLHR